MVSSAAANGSVARGALALATAVLLVTSAGCGRRPATFPGAPVVLVSIDTLRADHLPAYGGRDLETPHLDRFLRDAILFENAYSPCPMTLPAHVSMLTGLVPPQHGVRNNVGFTFDGAAHPTIASLLKARGYATGAAVSSYVLRHETGLGALFDDYEDSIDPRQGAAFDDYQRPGGVTARIASAWIDARKGRPFFFFLHVYEPHVPYDPPEPFRSRYAARPYDGEIAAADQIVGAFLQHLRETGVYDRALVIVTSDHGEGLGDHGEAQHSILLYREAIRVPLLVKLPGAARAGTTVAAPAALVDILPTVLRTLGVEPPPEIAGVSLVSLADGGVPARAIYGETLYPRLQLGWSALRSIVEGNRHYIDGPRPELYDMAADPGERDDRSAADASDAARLAAAIERVPRGQDAPGAVDPQTEEKLRALGYVGTARERGSQVLPNPRDNLQLLAPLAEGFRLAALGRSDAAAAALQSVVAANPAMVEAWIKLAEVRSAAGRYREAVEAFDEAVARSTVPLSDVMLERGDAKLRAGAVGEAETDARAGLATNPGKAHELLARVALARRDGILAEREARAAVGERNPQPATMLVLADVLMQRGDLAGAGAVLDSAAARARELGQPAVPRLDFLRADLLARTGRPVEAEAAYEQALARFPADVQAYANLAVLEYLLGKRGAADDVVERMVRASPQAQTFAVAVRTFETLGDAPRAAAWRRRAAERR